MHDEVNSMISGDDFSMISEDDKSSLNGALTMMSEDEHQKIENEAVKIQSNFRRWMFQKKIKSLDESVRQLQRKAKG